MNGIEERTNELEYRTTEITQSEWQRENKLEKKINRNLCYNRDLASSHVVKALEGRQEEGKAEEAL